MMMSSEHLDGNPANEDSGLTSDGIIAAETPPDYSQRERVEENVMNAKNQIFHSSFPFESNDESDIIEATTNNSIHSSFLLEQGLFFLAGLGSSIGYIATLSSLVYFKVLFGPNSFIYLNLAVYLPLLPVSIAQARWDQFYDKLYQTRVTFLVRSVVGFTFVVSGTVGMILSCPSTSDSVRAFGAQLGWVIFNALQQGTGGAILYGQLNQLASFAGSRVSISGCENTAWPLANGDRTDNAEDPSSFNEDLLPRKFKAAVSSGIQASALVVLTASFGSGFRTMNGSRFRAFLSVVVAMEVLCFALSIWLLVARPRVLKSMIGRDCSMRLSEIVAGGDDPEVQSLLRRGTPITSQSSTPPSVQYEQPVQDATPGTLLQPLLASPSSVLPSPSLPLTDSTLSTSCELDMADLWHYSQSSCWALALTLVPSFLVGSWFTRVQTDWMELAQILFYVRIAMDLVGRLATIVLPVATVSSVVWMASLRLVVVILFFSNASKGIGSGIRIVEQHRDALSILLVAIIAFFSGYLVTSSYQLAPQQLPLDARANSVAKQASLLTVAFSISAIGGLVSSFVFIALGV